MTSADIHTLKPVELAPDWRRELHVLLDQMLDELCAKRGASVGLGLDLSGPGARSRYIRRSVACGADT